jgi:hypothetical protein
MYNHQRFDQAQMPVANEVPIIVSTSPLKKENTHEIINQEVITSRSNFNKSSKKKLLNQIGEHELGVETH